VSILTLQSINSDTFDARQLAGRISVYTVSTAYLLEKQEKRFMWHESRSKEITGRLIERTGKKIRSRLPLKKFAQDS